MRLVYAREQVSPGLYLTEGHGTPLRTLPALMSPSYSPPTIVYVRHSHGHLHVQVVGS